MTFVIRTAVLLTFGLAAGLAAGLATSTPAQAITFATGQGTDNAGCGAVTSPCRTLHQAVTNTPAGGYIVLQGPANFGPVTIDKAISIVGERGATIRANNIGDGPLPIAIGGPGDISTIVVRLRGLTIEGAGIGKTGVTWIGGARLEIADCVIRNFSYAGIEAAPYLPTSLTYRSFLSVVDSVIENAAIGLGMRSIRIGVSAFIDGLKARNNEIGVAVQNDGREVARAVAINSAATNNALRGSSFSGGFVAVSRIAPDMLAPPPPGAGLFVVKSVASGNNSGVTSGLPFPSDDDTDGAVSVSRSVLTGNGAANGGAKLAHSYGGNVIRGNTDDTLSRFSLQPLH